MDFSAIEGGCHQSLHRVPRTSNCVSSEHSSSKLQFSGLLIVPAAARLFLRLGLLTLLLVLPSNPPSAYARSFSNDSVPAQAPIAVALDAPPALPSDASPPLRSTANSPSPSPGAPGPTLGHEKGLSRRLRDVVIVVSVLTTLFLASMCVVVGILMWMRRERERRRRPVIIYISADDGDLERRWSFAWLLKLRMEGALTFRIIHQGYLNLNGYSPRSGFGYMGRILLGVVVITEEYFKRRRNMEELIFFMENQKNGIHILPVFYGLTRDQLKCNLEIRTWEPYVSRVKCKEAVQWLCSVKGIVRDPHMTVNDDIGFVNEVHEAIIFYERQERSFASILRWGRAALVERVTVRRARLIGTRKRRNHANQRIGKESGLTMYVNKRTQLLFALAGLLNILLSVILDNFFNDLPVRFAAFAVFAPLTIFLGGLASGWFPRIPLWFIAFVKRRGFLRQVVPCSPWHDNVVTDYCGEVSFLEPLEPPRGTTLFELPALVKSFLDDQQDSPQSPVPKASTHVQSSYSTDRHVTEATTHGLKSDLEIGGTEEGQSEQEGKDLQILPDIKLSSETLKPPQSERATSQVSSSNVKEAPSQVEDIATTVVDMDRSSGGVFRILHDERAPILAPILEFDGPEINNFRLNVRAFKNASAMCPTFDLSCTFRNKKTTRMYLTTEELRNLVQNMRQWIESPHPIVVDESSDVLHCLAIEDILREFTKELYAVTAVCVEHRFLAGLGGTRFLIVLSYFSATFMLSLIPLVSDKKSYFFLFFLFVLVPYLVLLKTSNPLSFYDIRSLLCPIYVKIFGFSRLYKSRSPFRWCNEFRKKRIVNPTYFWVDQEYANSFPDADSCSFTLSGCVDLPDSPPKHLDFFIRCQGWPAGASAISQHDYTLRVYFDSVELNRSTNISQYTNVRLAFSEGDCLLGNLNYAAVEVPRVQLVEKLFHCFSNPSFGGYVEKICPTGFFSTTFVAHCPRFLDFCNKILSSEGPKQLLVASRKPGSTLVVGVPFWDSEGL